MTRRPDMHQIDTDDEPRAPHGAWIGWLFVGAVAFWLALAVYAWLWRV